MPFLRLPKMNCLLTTNRLTMCRCQSRWSRAKPSFGFETCHCVDAKPSPESRNAIVCMQSFPGKSEMPLFARKAFRESWKCHCLHAKPSGKVGNAIVCMQSLPGKLEMTLLARKAFPESRRSHCLHARPFPESRRSHCLHARPFPEFPTNLCTYAMPSFGSWCGIC